MPDMLVKLYGLPDMAQLNEKMHEQGVTIRRAIPPEKHIVTEWVLNTFNRAWASECEAAFANHPVSCFIAIKDGRPVGFACHDATCRDFFGPTGVERNERGKGIGTVLLLECLYAMKAQGYAYAIIGGVGPAAFYSKTVGAIPIEGSEPGIYRGMMR